MRKQSKQQISGREGERWLLSILPSEWVFHRPAEDFGIDGVVTIGDEASVSPIEFGVQVKSRSRWRRKDGCILVDGIDTDMIRYWAFRLLPTVLVIYERDSKAGFYVWLPDVITSEHLEKSAPQTQAIAVPGVQQLTSVAWSDIRARATRYHEIIGAGLHRSDAQRAIMKTLRALAMSLRLLQATPEIWRRGKHGRMEASLFHAVAHTEVVNSLMSLATILDHAPTATKAVRNSASAYEALCSTFLHPFEQFRTADRPAAVWANEKRMKELRPQMEAMLSEIMVELTSVH